MRYSATTNILFKLRRITGIWPDKVQPLPHYYRGIYRAIEAWLFPQNHQLVGAAQSFSYDHHQEISDARLSYQTVTVKTGTQRSRVRRGVGRCNPPFLCLKPDKKTRFDTAAYRKTTCRCIPLKRKTQNDEIVDSAR